MGRLGGVGTGLLEPGEVRTGLEPFLSRGANVRNNESAKPAPESTTAYVRFLRLIDPLGGYRLLMVTVRTFSTELLPERDRSGSV
jgi:hypothetical protein